MATQGAGAQVVTCSTTSVPAAEAFDCWRELISDTFVPLTAVPTTSRPFRGELRVVTHRTVQLTEVRAAGQHVQRTRRLIAESSEDYLLASIQLGGRGRVEQDGRTAVLTPGAMSFYDSTRPYTLHFDDAFEQLVVQTPRRPLLAAAGIVDDAVHVTATALQAGGPGSVLAGFFSSLSLLHGRDPAGALQLSAHAPGLLASALRLAAGQRPTGPDAADLDRERVLAHLHRHAADPGLDADSIAAACHLSRRALFRVVRGSAGLSRRHPPAPPGRPRRRDAGRPPATTGRHGGCRLRVRRGDPVPPGLPRSDRTDSRPASSWHAESVSWPGRLVRRGLKSPG